MNAATPPSRTSRLALATLVPLAACELVDPLDDITGGQKPMSSSTPPGECRPAQGRVCINGVCRCNGGSSDQAVCDPATTGSDSCAKLCDCR